MENIWELSSKGKGQDSSWLVTIVSYDWEIYGRGWGLVPIPCSGPIGKPTYYFKILAPPGVTQKNWPFSNQSTQGNLRLSDGKSEAQNRRWNESGVTPGGVIFIPDEFNLKWEMESQKQKQWGIRKPNSDNTPGRFKCHTYGAHTCKYPVNCGNYTKRDLKWKWPNWGSFDSPKLILLHD